MDPISLQEIFLILLCISYIQQEYLKLKLNLEAQKKKPMDTGQGQSESEWKSFLKILLMIENLDRKYAWQQIFYNKE